MERRPAAAYDFNEPTLERLLDGMAARLCDAGGGDGATDARPPAHVIVAMMFMLPGKHAGAGGDVATIISTAEERSGRATGGGAALCGAMTPPLAEHPLIEDVLVDRLHEGMGMLVTST